MQTSSLRCLGHTWLIIMWKNSSLFFLCFYDILRPYCPGVHWNGHGKILIKTGVSKNFIFFHFVFYVGEETESDKKKKKNIGQQTCESEGVKLTFWYKPPAQRSPRCCLQLFHFWMSIVNQTGSLVEISCYILVISLWWSSEMYLVVLLSLVDSDSPPPPSVWIILPDAVIGVCVTVDVTHESLPVQPAHSGFQRQAIIQRLSGGKQ